MNPEELHNRVKAIAQARAAADDGLLRALSAACWPGGGRDRADPVAAEWVRRWRPGTGHGVFPVCSCRLGRCALCN
ncbi:MAG TPA: hypothetical protein VF781_01880 [Solirubrobacteraceae bacterium]